MESPLSITTRLSRAFFAECGHVMYRSWQPLDTQEILFAFTAGNNSGSAV